MRDTELERITAIDFHGESDGPIQIITTSVMPSEITSVTDNKSPTPKRKLNDNFNDTSNNVAKLSKR